MYTSQLKPRTNENTSVEWKSEIIWQQVIATTSMDQLDPVYVAMVMFRRREFDSCIDICTAILDRNPYDEAVWSLKTRSLTAQVNCVIFIQLIATE